MFNSSFRWFSRRPKFPRANFYINSETEWDLFGKNRIQVTLGRLHNTGIQEIWPLLTWNHNQSFILNIFNIWFVINEVRTFVNLFVKISFNLHKNHSIRKRLECWGNSAESASWASHFWCYSLKSISIIKQQNNQLLSCEHSKTIASMSVFLIQQLTTRYSKIT